MDCSNCMNIVVASDQNYLPHLMTLISSIGKNHTKESWIKVHILDSGITNEGKQKIVTLANKFNHLKFVFYAMPLKMIQQKLGKIKYDRSLAAFARIFIPEIIKEDRAIYLDVDGIVLNSLDQIYQIDMEGYAIAGVLDINPIQRHRLIGLTDNMPYVNSGMIVWNLEKCRQLQFTRLCIDYIESKQGNVDAMDQGTINGVLSPKELIKIIPPQFNVLTPMFQLNKKQILSLYQLLNYYEDEEIYFARKKPVFVHFTPNLISRPWEKNCVHPLKDQYWEYRLDVMDEMKVLQSDNRSFKLRFLSIIYLIVPKDLFILLFNWKKTHSMKGKVRG